MLQHTTICLNYYPGGNSLLRFRAHLLFTFILNILRPCYSQTFQITAILVGSAECDESGCEGRSWEHYVVHVPAVVWRETGEGDREPSPWGRGSWL